MSALGPWVSHGALAETHSVLPRELREAIGNKVGVSPDAPNFLEQIRAIPGRATEMQKRESFAQSFGVSRGAIDLKEIFSRPTDVQSSSTVPQVVVDRATFEEGEPLVVTQAAAEVKLIESIKSADYSAEIATIQSTGRELTKRFTHPPEIPACKGGNTVKAEVPPGTGTVDILILNSPPPVDTDERFGRLTQVQQYHPGDAKDVNSMVIALAQPECLPYRVRILDGKRYIHYGEFALRNYDEHPLGSGKRYRGDKRK